MRRSLIARAADSHGCPRVDVPTHDERRAAEAITLLQPGEGGWFGAAALEPRSSEDGTLGGAPTVPATEPWNCERTTRRVTGTVRAQLSPTPRGRCRARARWRRALGALISSSSDLGSESQVIAPPTETMTSSGVTMRCGSRSRSIARRPDPAERAGVRLARPRLEFANRRAVAAIFGRAGDPPRRNVARRRSTGRDLPRGFPRRSRRCGARSRSARPRRPRRRGPNPGVQTRPRSLRSRSTIIASSARSFSLARSSRARITSSASVRAAMGSVPLIGRVSTSRPRTRREAIRTRATNPHGDHGRRPPRTAPRCDSRSRAWSDHGSTRPGHA